MIFAIDFDGTIVVTKEYPVISGLVPGAKECMELMKRKGHQIIIWTCRSNQHLDAAVLFLTSNNIPFDTVNENVQENIDEWKNNPRKVFADVYIDDRNFNGVNWEEIMLFVQSL